MLEELADDRFDVHLADIRRPVLSFSEDETVSAIWEEMLKRKEHIAQIHDEYGCFQGIVTMEDVIETLLGLEIVDETDTVADMQALAREKWRQRLDSDNRALSALSARTARMSPANPDEL